MKFTSALLSLLILVVCCTFVLNQEKDVVSDNTPGDSDLPTGDYDEKDDVEFEEDNNENIKEKNIDPNSTLEDLENLENMSQEEIEARLREEEAEFSRQVIDDMGINNMEEITKDTFREYITRVILTQTDDDGEKPEEEDPEEEEFLNLLIEEIMKEIPDVIPKEEFPKYANTDNYKHIVDKILKDKFGDNYSEDIVKMMQGSFDAEKEGMPSQEEMEELMHEFEKNKDKGGNNDEGEMSQEELEELQRNIKDLKGDHGDINTEDLIKGFNDADLDEDKDTSHGEDL